MLHHKVIGLCDGNAAQSVLNIGSVMLHLDAFLSSEYALLRAYLGDVAFARLIAAHARKPGRASLRQAAAQLPGFIALSRSWARQKEAAELARLEQALNAAQATPVIPALTPETLASLTEESPTSSVVSLHPSASILAFHTNAVSIASALRCGEMPPPAARLEARQAILVWQQGDGPRFRVLGQEEESALLHLQRGISASLLQATPAGLAREAKNPLPTYLTGWMEAGLLIANAGGRSKRARQKA